MKIYAKYNEEAKNYTTIIEITNDECDLMYDLISNHINIMTKVYRKQNKNWHIVSRMTKHGHGFSEDICYRLGVNPDSYRWERIKV